jgi:hypothetical protein
LQLGGRISGGEDLWCYLPKRAGLANVTRPGPKGGEAQSRAEHSRPMGRSRIKGPAAGSKIRRESVAVEREFAAVQCAALIAPYGVPLRGEAAPPHQHRERLITLR